MSVLRSLRRGRRVAEPAKVGVAWFDPEQYQRLLEVADDRSSLHQSYEGWLAAAERILAQTSSSIIKVPFNVEAWMTWCQATGGRPLDGSSRSLYVSQWLLDRGLV